MTQNYFMKQLFIFLLLFLSIGSSAQDSTDYGFESNDKKRSSYNAYFFNFHLDRVSGLNNLLLSNDFPGMNQYGNEIGTLFGFGKNRGKLIPLVKVFYYDRRTIGSSARPNSASITAWGAGLGAEYKLLESKWLFIRPQIIVNFATYTLNFIQNEGNSSIDGILNSDYNEYSFRSGQIPLQAGINLGTSVIIGPARLGILVGAGYMLNWTNDNWKIGSNTQVSDKINLSSPYISVGTFTTMK